MKVKDPHPAKHGTNDARHQQADVASRDYAKQREAGARDAEAKAKKQKKSGK